MRLFHTVTVYVALLFLYFSLVIAFAPPIIPRTKGISASTRITILNMSRRDDSTSKNPGKTWAATAVVATYIFASVAASPTTAIAAAQPCQPELRLPVSSSSSSMVLADVVVTPFGGGFGGFGVSPFGWNPFGGFGFGFTVRSRPMIVGGGAETSTSDVQKSTKAEVEEAMKETSRVRGEDKDFGKQQQQGPK